MSNKLLKCFTFGFVGNLFFVIFSIVCYIYYQAFGSIGIVVKFIEVTAYVCEALGFIFSLIAIILFSITVRQRTFMKIGYAVYILVELVMMYMELNSYDISFYKPYSLVLAIIHSIFSALICFTFLQLEPKNTVLQVIVVVSVAIMFFGMMGNIFGIRIYFSILTNAIAYIVMFTTIKFYVKQERIEIDCYGDEPVAVKYSNSFFEENDF